MPRTIIMVWWGRRHSLGTCLVSVVVKYTKEKAGFKAACGKDN